MTDSPKSLQRRYEREKAARLEAESLLEEKASELYETLMRVNSSEALLRSALNSMTDGLLLTGPEEEVILVNQQIGLIYPEYSDHLVQHATLTGKFTPLLENPDYRAMVEQGASEAYFEIELGDDRVIAVGVRLTREGFMASTHRDITGIRQGERERRRLLMDLMSAQRLQSIGRMSSMIAHDFNNIVASIKGYAGFLEEDLPADSLLHDSASRILTSTRKAQALIRQILEYGNQRQLARQQVSLIPVLEDCLDMLDPKAVDSVNIVFDPPEEPIWIEADEIRLSRMFTNLIANALQAMSGRRGELTLAFDRFESLDLSEITCNHPGLDMGKLASVMVGLDLFVTPCVRVAILDNGTGMDPKLMGRAFEIYFSTRKDGKTGGLGLASVADIAIDFGGAVKLSSQLDAGTVTEVVLPIAMEAGYSAQSRPPTLEDTLFDVMVIEDDEDVGQMMQLMLERANIRTRLYTCPQAAMKDLLADPDRWKVVVSDQIMPNMKGTEIYQGLLDAGIDIPFILCTAQVDAESAGIASNLRSDLVTKPIDKDELISRVRHHIR
jgi:signal transduction histidine kinase